MSDFDDAELHDLVTEEVNIASDRPVLRPVVPEHARPIVLAGQVLAIDAGRNFRIL